MSLKLNPGKGHVEPSDVMGSKTDSAVISFLSLNQDMCVLQVEGTGMVVGQALPHSKFTLPAVKGLNVTLSPQPTPHPSEVSHREEAAPY